MQRTAGGATFIGLATQFANLRAELSRRNAAFVGTAHQQDLDVLCLHMFGTLGETVLPVMAGFKQVIERVDDIVVVGDLARDGAAAGKLLVYTRPGCAAGG